MGSESDICETHSIGNVEEVNADKKQKDEQVAYVVKQPAWVVWSAALTCLVSGVMCNLAVKLQNREEVAVCADPTCEVKSFEQPFWQTFIMFCGEAICLPTWLLDSYLAKRKGKDEGIFEWPQPEDKVRRTSAWWWWAAPAFVDLTGTAIVNMAFGMTYVSTVQMLRNSILVMTSLMSIAMMRRPLRVHEWAGILIMTGGMIASGVQAIMTPDDSSTVDSSKAWLGIVLTLVGTVFNAFQLILEEKLFQKGYSPPLRGVGYMGCFGIAFNLLAIGVCHWAGFYNIQHGWYQMNHNTNVMVGNLWYLVVVYIFNGSGLATTFVGSGLLRGVIYSCRAPILFLIELALKWQSFTVGALIGLILSVIGFFVYAYMIPFVNRRATPKTHRVLRKDVPCCCTRPLPPSDDEEGAEAANQLEAGESSHKEYATSENIEG